MFINNEGQPDTNRRYRDLAIELRARARADYRLWSVDPFAIYRGSCYWDRGPPTEYQLAT